MYSTFSAINNSINQYKLNQFSNHIDLYYSVQNVLFVLIGANR